MTGRVSVVITAHNAARTLSPCLDSLNTQPGCATGGLEVIVVDDRSTDNTSGIARRAGISCLTVVRLSDYSDRSLTARQVALVAGIQQSSGEVVLLLDADATVTGDWSTALATPILTGDADVVAGGVAFDAPVSAGGGVRALAALQTVDAAYYLLVCRVLNAAGIRAGMLFGSAAVGRAMYEQLGGFQHIGHALTEDLAFARAVKAHGGRIAFSLRARVRVNACRSVEELVRRAVRTSAGGVSLLASVLAVWMLLLPLTAVGAAVAGGGWWLLLAVRYIAGVVFAIVAVTLSGQSRPMPYALIYEPASLVVGGCALIAVRRTRQVEWGGIRYDRHRRRSVVA